MTQARMPMSEMAMLCRDCSFGLRSETCAACGRWVGGSRGVPARLCSDCGISRMEECVVCGNWTAGRVEPAMLCPDCAARDMKETCVRCGKWAP